MHNTNSAFSAILYQNTNKTVTLLDIPKSISLAQSTPEHPANDQQIYSSQPLQAPYPSTEPRSQRAKANVLRSKAPSDTNELGFSETCLRQALVEIAENGEGRWCLERKISPFAVERQSDKRDLEEPTPPALSSRHQNSKRHLGSLSPARGSKAAEDSKHLSSRTEPDLRISEELLQSRRLSEPLVLCTDPGSRTSSCHNKRSITNRLVCNPNATQMSLQCSESSYNIPPGTNFLLSKIGQATAPALSMAALTMLSDSSATAGPGQFDFFLLDPPWENRSVKRSAKYETMSDSDPMAMLRSSLGQHIAPGGLIACWVTNKTAARDAGLEAFADWGVQLIEVWAWLKTTVHGVPVTEIEGLWRKPYELLLIGRRRDKEAEGTNVDVRMRVIVAVPDLHSRKPNLKELIEPMLPARYRAFEVFARNLTAGWWAWGDEVLKYNWEGHWSQSEGGVLKGVTAARS